MVMMVVSWCIGWLLSRGGGGGLKELPGQMALKASLSKKCYEKNKQASKKKNVIDLLSMGWYVQNASKQYKRGNPGL